EREETEALQAEYTRLFLNGYPRTVCPPYESVYLEQRMHGEAAVAVAAAYAEWEMKVEPGLIDHLATELEFLAFLASAESLDGDMSTEARKASDEFFQKHLRRWTPRFIADLKSGAKLDCYRMLGELMESVLAEGCEME
ncbi:MAG: molecular chaperone TorD family protein, partial [Chlorobaculum sp.]|nr:molecular chaperone TorD family protein [Chlorobaculum sp.]